MFGDDESERNGEELQRRCKTPDLLRSFIRERERPADARPREETARAIDRDALFQGRLFERESLQLGGRIHTRSPFKPRKVASNGRGWFRRKRRKPTTTASNATT